MMLCPEAVSAQDILSPCRYATDRSFLQPAPLGGSVADADKTSKGFSADDADKTFFPVVREDTSGASTQEHTSDSDAAMDISERFLVAAGLCDA